MGNDNNKYQTKYYDSRQTRTKQISCIISTYYQDCSTEHHDIILQCINGAYELICTDVHNDLPTSHQYSMEQKINNMIKGKCEIQSTIFPLIFIGNIYEDCKSISSVTRNLPKDLIKIPLKSILEIKTDISNSYYYVNNDGKSVVFVSKNAIDQIQKNAKILKGQYNDYFCKKYNYLSQSSKEKN